MKSQNSTIPALEKKFPFTSSGKAINRIHQKRETYLFCMVPKCFISLWFIVLGTLEKMFQKPHFKLRKDDITKTNKKTVNDGRFYIVYAVNDDVNYHHKGCKKSVCNIVPMYLLFERQQHYNKCLLVIN